MKFLARTSLSLALLAASAIALATSFSTTPSVLIRAGLGDRALTAAGVSSSEVASVVADVESSAASQQNLLSTADAAYAAARAEVDQLRRLVRSGQATQGEVTELQTAKADLAAAETQRQQALDALFAAGVADLSAAQQSSLSTLLANASREVPIEFLVVNRSDADWLALRELLDHEKVCAKTGQTPDPNCVSALAALRSDSAVAAAKTNLDTNLVAVQAAWESAVEQ